MRSISAIADALSSVIPSGTAPASDGALALGLLTITLIAGLAGGFAVGRVRRDAGEQSVEHRHDDLTELADGPDRGFVRLDTTLIARMWSPGMDPVLDEIAATDRRSSGTRNWWSAIHPEDRPRLRTMLRGLESNRSADCDFRMRTTRDGWRSMIGTAHRQPDGHRAILFHDDSERATAERTLESAARLRRTMDVAIEALAEADDVDQAMCELLTLIGGELGLRSIGWFELGARAECRRIASWTREVPPGVPMPVPVAIEGGMLDRLEAGQSVHRRDPDGERFIAPIRIDDHVDSVLVTDFEPDGDRRDEVALVFGRFCDAVGRRLEREDSKRERESFTAVRGSIERSEVLLQLAGGLRHDFNNVAFAIGGRVSLLLQRTADPIVADGLQEIREAVDDAGRLIDRFFPAGDGTEQPVQIPVRAELQQIADSAKRLLPRRLDLELVLDDDLHAIGETITIEAAPDALQRLVLNLVVNSRDAIPSRGRIRISAGHLDPGRVEIRIEDDGPGILPTDRERFLQPFESGPGSSGAGVGLSLCDRATTAMGGRFELSDSPLGGLSARIVLPVSTQTPCRVDPEPAGPGAGSRMPRAALVVEDNPIIREVITTHLEQAGTRVINAKDAVGVEEILEDDPGIEILIMDIDLPGRSGIDCISAVRAEGNRTPCLLITGGTGDPPPLPRTMVLRKPFGMAPLLSTVRSLITEFDPEPDPEHRRP